MALDILDAREFVISILQEIDGGMLPCQIVNRSRDLRWSKKRYFAHLSKILHDKQVKTFAIL